MPLSRYPRTRPAVVVPPASRPRCAVPTPPNGVRRRRPPRPRAGGVTSARNASRLVIVCQSNCASPIVNRRMDASAPHPGAPRRVLASGRPGGDRRSCALRPLQALRPTRLATQRSTAFAKATAVRHSFSGGGTRPHSACGRMSESRNGGSPTGRRSPAPASARYPSAAAGRALQVITGSPQSPISQSECPNSPIANHPMNRSIVNHQSPNGRRSRTRTAGRPGSRGPGCRSACA